MPHKRKPEEAESRKPFKKTKTKSTTVYLVEPRPDWHAVDETSREPHPSDTTVTHGRATKLLQDENDAYQKQQASGSSQKFLRTIMTSGTSDDRIAALTLVVQEAPLHNMKAMENLLGLARKKSRDQALKALAALKDLFGEGVVLPQTRKLRAYGKQTHSPTTDHQAVLYAYEDWLKQQYFVLLQLLEERCNDEVAYARSRAITFIFELLKAKPEQEENLLRLLVHKLGDKDGKIASRASYLLLQLQVEHPAMKLVVTTAISEFILRPGNKQYYGVITLNQTVLGGKDEELADRLLSTYFSLFVQLLKDSAAESQDHEKLLSQVLTGVNRAVPFVNANESFNKQLDLLYQVTHSANFNTAVQALMLLQRLTGSSERFYRTLYESLLDPRLITSNKQVLYLNMLYKSLKIADIKRVQAFVKRLLQIINVNDPSFACSVIFLVYELIHQFPSLQSMLTEPEDQDDTEQTYDARKRDPAHAHAGTTALWDVLPLLHHYHPSVSSLSESIVESRTMSKPDPAAHTLLHFLDRFQFRTPKIKQSHGSSIMQPSAGSDAADLLVKPGVSARSKTKVNSEVFWEKQIEDIAPQDVFFHSYFNQSNNKQRKAKQKKSKAATADEDDSEAGEDEIWQAIANSRPEVEGDISDDDISVGDLESAYSDSDGDDGIDLGGADSDSDGGIDLGGEGDDSEGGVASDLDQDDSMPELESDLDDEEDEVAIDIEQSGDSGAMQPSQGKKDKDRKKLKLKQLPTFASVDDYAKLLEDEPDEF